MDINKYTEKAQEAILGAQRLAEQMSHAQIEPEHVLTALVEQREGRERPLRSIVTFSRERGRVLQCAGSRR